VTSSTSPTYGSYSVTTAGDWTYTLDNTNSTIQALGLGESTTDSITVTGEDGTTKTITITINGANDAPVVSALIADASTNEQSAYSHDVSSSFSDDDGDTLTYTATLSNGSKLPLWLTMSSTGTLSGTPDNGDVGDIAVKVTATESASNSVSDTYILAVNNVDNVSTAPSSVTLIQVRNVEAMSQLRASMNEHGADYVDGSTDNVVQFELWLDASALSQLDSNANEIFDFSFDIAWDNAELKALGWGVTGDQLALDNSFVSYNYNNASDMAITFNPDNNGVASIALSSNTSVVDTLTPLFGADNKGTEMLIATFYAAPSTSTDTINMSIENMNVGTNLIDNFNLSNYSVAIDTSTSEASIQTDSTHYLDNISINYIDNEGDDTGISSLVENGKIELGQLVDFNVVTLSNSNAYASGIQSNDATAILKHIVGLDILADGSVNIHAADVNNNGSVQTNDATAILKHIVGLDSINNFDLIDNLTGQRMTHLDGNMVSIADLTIVENGDVNQSGSFGDDYTILIDLI